MFERLLHRNLIILISKPFLSLQIVYISLPLSINWTCFHCSCITYSIYKVLSNAGAALDNLPFIFKAKATAAAHYPPHILAKLLLHAYTILPILPFPLHLLTCPKYRNVPPPHVLYVRAIYIYKKYAILFN